MIKNIVFDMGNVLLDYNPEVPLNKFCKSEKAKEIIRKELFGGAEWVQLDLGSITVEEAFESIASRIPEQYYEELRECIFKWDICMIPLEGAKEFLQYVKGKRYKLFILSNAHKSFYEYFPRAIDLNIFDGAVVSADIHIVKPDIRIYEHLLKTYKLNPAECLFIDDRADNVEGAKAAGINAIQFNGDFEEIKSIL